MYGLSSCIYIYIDRPFCIYLSICLPIYLCLYPYPYLDPNLHLSVSMSKKEGCSACRIQACEAELVFEIEPKGWVH